MVTFGSHVGNHQFQPFLSGVYAGVISCEKAGCPDEQTAAYDALEKARAVYSCEGLLGSHEKDVLERSAVTLA